jgi:hypothetical protein
MLRATPQLSAQPCSSSGLLFEHSRDSPGDTRLPAGVCTLDPYSSVVPTSSTFELSRVTSRGPPSGPRAATMASQLCISRDIVVLLASLHPCQQAARFLVHTLPPDHCGLLVSADHAETPAFCIASFVTKPRSFCHHALWTGYNRGFFAPRFLNGNISPLSRNSNKLQCVRLGCLDTASLLKLSCSTGSGNFLKTAPASSLIFTRYFPTSLPIPRSVVLLLGPKSCIHQARSRCSY